MNEPLHLDSIYLKMIHRHFINIMCCDRSPMGVKQKKDLVYNFSAFVVSVNEMVLVCAAAPKLIKETRDKSV